MSPTCRTVAMGHELLVYGIDRPATVRQPLVQEDLMAPPESFGAGGSTPLPGPATR